MGRLPYDLRVSEMEEEFALLHQHFQVHSRTMFKPYAFEGRAVTETIGFAGLQLSHTTDG